MLQIVVCVIVLMYRYYDEFAGKKYGIISVKTCKKIPMAENFAGGKQGRKNPCKNKEATYFDFGCR
jgi:hypothetical protein